MKNLVFYILMILLPASLLAQDNSVAKGSTGFNSVYEAGDIAEQIVNASGLEVNFAIAEADVPNAVAVLLQGKRYVLYNPRFMNSLTHITGTKWAAISVLAHEIGHHLYGKSSAGRKLKLATELEADEFSGYVLEKMGATLAEAQAAMSILPATKVSLTHPARADRILSIAKGWKNAGGEVMNETTAVVLSRPEEPFETGMKAIIHFDAKPGGKYYVTNEMKLVSVEDSGSIAIGQLSRSNDAEFPYLIQDDTGYRLYVHRSGDIYNKRGTIVGRVKSSGGDD